MRKNLQWAVPLKGMTLALLLSTMFMLAGGGTAALAGQEGNGARQGHHGYSVASISGSYAFVGTYAGHVAASFGVVTFDGFGSVKGSVIANQPNPDGSRDIVTVGLAGIYSVNRDGTGTISYLVTFPDGHAATVTEDLVITNAEAHGGMLIATSVFDAQEQPSVVLSGQVFVMHTYTRRPD